MDRRAFTTIVGGTAPLADEKLPTFSGSCQLSVLRN